MTLKLPQRKVAAIIRQCLQGKPQCDIAEKEGVNQATVSLWWTQVSRTITAGGSVRRREGVWRV